MLLSTPSVWAHIDPTWNIGSMKRTSLMTLQSQSSDGTDGSMDFAIKGFSYGINNRKWLLDANDISIIVCKDRSEELIYEDLMHGPRMKIFWGKERVVKFWMTTRSMVANKLFLLPRLPPPLSHPPPLSLSLCGWQSVSMRALFY